MVSDLRDVIERADIPVCGEAIAAALRARDVLDAKIAVAVGRYDAEDQAALDGAHSTIGFLKQCGVAQPSKLARIARRTRQLGAMARAWVRGDLTSGQVDAIVANVDDATIEQLVEHEADLVPKLRDLSPHDTASVMRTWKSFADARVDRAADEPQCTAHLSELLDGRGRLDADLDAEGMALARAALETATSEDAEGEARTASERRGDALKEVFRHYLDHQHDTSKTRNRPHVSFVVDAATLSGAPATPAAVKQALCDSDLSRVVTKGRSEVIDVGRVTRVIPAALFLALVLRDRHCRHPGCDRPPQWCEAHHVVHWTDGGPTVLWNLVLKCSRHHHLGHLPGWTEKLEPDGTYHLTAPDGRTWTTHAPGVLTLAA